MTTVRAFPPFGLPERPLASDAPLAVPSVQRAVRAARVAGRLPAGVRIRAAVVVQGPLELEDPDLAMIEVRVAPSESQRFALP
jgi:hypothetical protein